MNKILVCSLLLSSLAIAGEGGVKTLSPHDAFKNAEDYPLNAPSDMYGSGEVTGLNLTAGNVFKATYQKWRMQRDVFKTFKTALKDPLFRSAADELIRQTPETFVTAWNLINAHMENPVVQNTFNNYGVLTGVMESAFSLEYKNLGFLEHVYGGPVDARSAILNLWRAASSPAEERLRYSAAYRYGID